MGEKTPSEQVLGRIMDLMSFIDEKGLKARENRIPRKRLQEFQALAIIANQYRKLADDLLKKEGFDDKKLMSESNLSKLNPHQRKFFERLDHIKRELIQRQHFVEAMLKSKIPKKPSKKEEIKKRKKKFRGVGGKEGWLPL